MVERSHNITKEDFLDKFQSMRNSLKGHSSTICKLANVTDSEFRRAKVGTLSDPIRLTAILNACEKVYQEICEAHNIIVD